MANTQIVKGGAAVTVLASGTYLSGATPGNGGTIYDSNGVAQVNFPSFNTLPVSANGVTLSAHALNNNTGKYDSATLQVSSAATLAAGSYTYLTPGPAGGSAMPFDLVVNPQVVKGGAAVNVPLLNGSSALTGSQVPPNNGTYSVSIWEGNTQVVPDTALDTSGGSVTVNGITFTLANPASAIRSLTLQAAPGSTVPIFTNAIVITKAQDVTSGPIDILPAAATTPPRNLSVLITY